MPKRLRVLHLITKLEFGGAQQNTLYTAGHLDPEAFEAAVACGTGGLLDEKARELEPRARVFWLRFLRREIRPWWDLLALWEIWRVLRRFKPDLVHTHSSKAGILGRWAARWAGISAIVHTYHGFGFNDYQPPLVKRLYAWLERRCAASTAQIVYVSRENMAYAQRHGIYGLRNPVLIRSGVPFPAGPCPLAPEAKRRGRRAMGLPEEALLAVSIGNLKPQKNPGHLVELARRFEKRRKPEVRFLFIGGTESPGRTMEGIAGTLPPNFHALGWREDARKILEVCDVFVLTSLWEGLPRSAVEALLAGLPVTAYATDGLKEIVQTETNGFLAPPGDLDALERGLETLRSNPQRRKEMGERAVRSIGNQFDINRMVRQQEVLYARLAGPASQRPDVNPANVPQNFQR